MIDRIKKYQLESNDIDDCDDDDEIELKMIHGEKNIFSIVFLYVITNHGEIEVDYLGKLTKDKEKFEECFNFLCNYQGISSTLNRLILEIKTMIHIKLISIKYVKSSFNFLIRG